MAAAFVLLMLILAMTGHSSATWCICKEGVNDATLQKTLDYACGAGADCGATHQNGACYNPNTVRAHCNYAVNSYFQKKGQAVGSCDFAGTATVIPSDPSTAGCAYPASASATTPTTTTPIGNTPAGTSPLITTPSGGVGVGGGGINNGLGPSGNGINNDMNGGGSLLLKNNYSPTINMMILLLLSGLLVVFWRD